MLPRFCSLLGTIVIELSKKPFEVYISILLPVNSPSVFLLHKLNTYLLKPFTSSTLLAVNSPSTFLLNKCVENILLEAF